VVRIFQLVRIHLCYPHDKPHVVALDLRHKQSILRLQLCFEENCDVGRLNLHFFAGGAEFGQKFTRINLEVIIEDQDWALFLESPNLLIEFGVLVFEQRTVHRVVCQQIHEI